MVLVLAIDTSADAIGVAEKLKQALGLSFQLQIHSFKISASCAFAELPDHGTNEKVS